MPNFIKKRLVFEVFLQPQRLAQRRLLNCASDKLRAAIHKNAQFKSRPAPAGRVLMLMVMEPKRALNKEWVKTLLTLAPVNIAVAEFGSNPTYWQPTMRSVFCGLLTNSTGAELRTFEAHETLSGGLLGTNFPKRYRTRNQNFLSE
jgi:hypothetical protein